MMIIARMQSHEVDWCTFNNSSAGESLKISSLVKV